MTSRSVGATGAGVPIPSATKRANAWSRTPTPTIRTMTPATWKGNQINPDASTSQPVSRHGIRPATMTGASAKKSALPAAARHLLICEDALGVRHEPAKPGRGDPRELVVEHPAQALADRRQQAQRDEDPRLCACVPILLDAAFLLGPFDD